MKRYFCIGDRRVLGIVKKNYFRVLVGIFNDDVNKMKNILRVF